MSTSREAWWPYVKNVIRRYPELQDRLRQIKSAPITGRYGKTGGGSHEPGRSTEQIALRELPEKEQAYYDAVTKALQTTKRRADGALRVQMIDLVYFRKSHTLFGAAQVCHVSERTAQTWHGEFVRVVARNLGLR